MAEELMAGVVGGWLGGLVVSWLMWRRWGKPTQKLAAGGGEFTIGQLANKAADAFVGGEIIGGVGITGVILAAAGVILLVFGVGGQRLEAVAANGATLVTILGVVLVVFSGALYVCKKWLEAHTQVTLVSGYQQIVLAFIAKVNQGTVSANEVVVLAEGQMKSLSKLLAGSADLGEKTGASFAGPVVPEDQT